MWDSLMRDVFSPGSRTYYLSCILCTSHQYTNTTWKYHSNFLSLLNFSLDHKNHFHHLFQDFNLLNATFLQDTTRAFYMKEQTINSRAPFEIILLYLNFSVYTLTVQPHICHHYKWTLVWHLQQQNETIVVNIMYSLSLLYPLLSKESQKWNLTLT